MTVFRLATATVLLAGLALPALAQGTATTVPSVPALSGRALTMSGAAAPAATGPASPVAPMSSAATPTASAGVAAPHAAVVPGMGRTGLAPATLPSRADLGAAAEGRAERMGAERSVRSHHRLASAMRMEREHAPRGQGQTGEVAPDATR